MKFRRGSWYELERSRISHNINVYRRFLRLLEPHVNEAFKDWKQAIDQEAEQIHDEEQRDIFYDFHSDDFYEHQQYKSILMNSFFVSSYAFFECQVMEICYSTQQALRCPFSVNDLKSHSATTGAKVYLKKLGVAFPSDTSEWNEITHYNRIRNKIMHEDGSFDSEWQTREYAKKNGIVSSWHIDRDIGVMQLELTQPFCEEALDNYNLFLRKLHRAYEQRVKTHQNTGREVR